MPRPHTAWLIPAAFVLLAQATSAAPVCSARSGATIPPVVELYTSEGCSSCPPADRWLSQTQQQRPDAVLLAFHVDYWDRLGWKDRFAEAAYTQRQYEAVHRQRGGFAYTPQLMLNGQDWRGWPRGLPAATGPAQFDLSLTRVAQGWRADIRSRAPSTQALRIDWWLTEDGHQSRVRAGENQGATLLHDAVVRDSGQLPSTTLAPGQAQSLNFVANANRVAERPRTLSVVLSDPASAKPLQALQLRCTD